MCSFRGMVWFRIVGQENNGCILVRNLETIDEVVEKANRKIINNDTKLR